MKIKTFMKIAPKMPSERAILLRGDTGIGKSALGKLIAEEIGIPFIDVRASTMSEGDVGGYPDIEGMKKRNIMTFCMPSWFVRACQEPVLLMLEELNRAFPGVQQSFFQLVLDRALGNDEDGAPYHLHPGTRIIAAINIGSEYDVIQMGPALRRRFWVVDLEPSTNDWIKWAEKSNIDSVLIEFISQNPMHLRVEDFSKVDQDGTHPTPASWEHLDQSLKALGIPPSKIAGSPRTENFYSVCTGFIGVETTAAFIEFVEVYENIISAEDVLVHFSKKKMKAKVSRLSASRVLALVGKILLFLEDKISKEDFLDEKKTKKIKKYVKNLSDFMLTQSGEVAIHFWTKLTDSDKIKENIQVLINIHASPIGAYVTEHALAASKIAADKK